MAHVSIYFNFMGNAEEAFNFYKKVFKTEFSVPVMRIKDIPTQPGMPEFSQTDKNKVMHVALPILGGTEIMGTDMLESMGHKLSAGNNVTISLNPDTKEEADRLYKELSQEGTGGVAPHEEFWGYWGTCKDKYEIRWMFNVSNQPPIK
ncbi:MAG: VOC family protein [Bacteroidota bacterium]|nr:VOC family protein [Bacteroidota bacterium]